MGFLDALFGRTKPVKPDLDQLFGIPSAALTLEAGAGFKPTGLGSVCFAAVEGGAFVEVQRQVRALLDADTATGGVPVEASQDGYGYSWLLARHTPEELPDLVNDLHAVNSELEANGFGPQLLCSIVGFRNDSGQSLGLVYLYKRGSFYPFAPMPGGGEKRNSPLELQIKALLPNDLRLEPDLTRWFPVWGAPGL
ncbi:hypothetical protein CFP65_2325 [Kitasatospora sp. MMS16-BH015]|uniref:PspA-associated protein PspAB n=1 Tax=Kitasatospora sp. MMS16-BH015 TaxID=2018025 RepID=UPI000CA174F7|nr:hypothetical protein [Kitasatospora sp. MMS16-BH015]AUG77163.1 hypothetical protein CFP65_2325 [Kitasatospora sp. MMS16-BH015]